MNVLLDNMPMIGVNSFLAIIPVLCGWLMVKTRQKFLLVVLALLWFAFLPNTLYILTDLRYLPEQWEVMSTVGKLGLAVQYSLYELFGLSSFLLALHSLEKTLVRSRWREHKWLLLLLLIAVNFCIGFGMVLGRVQRLNSWDIFIAAPNVLHAAFHIMSSLELLRLGLLFGVVANLVYFVFRTYRGVSIALVSKSRK
ncbi:MAG: DUF1361 domain-containing protein [Ktedonobacteraceae bacterium]